MPSIYLTGKIDFRFTEHFKNIYLSIMQVYFGFLEFGENFIVFKNDSLPFGDKNRVLDLLIFLEKYADIQHCDLHLQIYFFKPDSSFSGMIHFEQSKFVIHKYNKNVISVQDIKKSKHFFQNLNENNINKATFYETYGGIKVLQRFFKPFLIWVLKDTEKGYVFLPFLSRFFFIEVKDDLVEYKMCDKKIYTYVTEIERVGFGALFPHSNFFTKRRYDDQETRQIHLIVRGEPFSATLYEPLMGPFPFYIPLHLPIIDLQNGERVDICSQCANRTKKIYKNCSPCTPKLIQKSSHLFSNPQV